MEADYWHEKWAADSIGFHQDSVNKRLTAYWSELSLSATSSQVFVPLCGKSLDMLWLHEQGHTVLGVELSHKAAKAFFTDNSLQCEIRSERDFDVFSGIGSAKGLSIMAGDYFSISPDRLAGFSAFYDRASLIAMNSTMRTQYANHLASIVEPGVKGLLLAIAYDQDRMKGPPFSVDDQSVRSLFQHYFAIEEIAHFGGPERLGNLADRGLETLDERVYLLKRNKTSVRQADDA